MAVPLVVADPAPGLGAARSPAWRHPGLAPSGGPGSSRPRRTWSRDRWPCPAEAETANLWYEGRGVAQAGRPSCRRTAGCSPCRRAIGTCGPRALAGRRPPGRTSCSLCSPWHGALDRTSTAPYAGACHASGRSGYAPVQTELASGGRPASRILPMPLTGSSGMGLPSNSPHTGMLAAHSYCTRYWRLVMREAGSASRVRRSGGGDTKPASSGTLYAVTYDLGDRRDPPRVFLSYSHDSEDHRERVLEFAGILRHFGVDAQLDRYVEVPPPPSWPIWMYDQMEAADLILVVCSEGYERRLLGRESEGKGRGAKWEGAIITQEAYEENTQRLVPVVLWPSDKSHIPYFLRPTTYYSVDVPTRSGLESLLRRLFNEPSVLPPPLGVRPAFPLANATSEDRATLASESSTDGRAGATPRLMTVGSEEQSHLAFAVEAAVWASEAAREDAPLEQAMLYLRESVQAFAQGLSEQVGETCRSIVYGVEVALGAPQVVMADDADLVVRPVATSAGPDPRARSAVRLRTMSDLNNVWLGSPAVYHNNDISTEASYSSPHWNPTTTPPYRATIVWPIVRRSFRSRHESAMFGFLTADSLAPNVFDMSRDEPIGALYAGILSFVLGDVGRMG